MVNFNPLSANPTKWSNTLKQFVANLSTNCLSVFDHFVKLALKGLKNYDFRIHLCDLSYDDPKNARYLSFHGYGLSSFDLSHCCITTRVYQICLGQCSEKTLSR